MKTKLLAIVLGLSMGSAAQAGDWQFGVGVSYVSGASDVIDLYENNLTYESPYYYVDVDVEEGLGIGLAFRSTYHADSGLRVDMGLGPFLIIAGDADYVEAPISATIGYNFNPSGYATPYVRAGAIYHIASGDYVQSSQIGALGAIGIEFRHGPGFSWGFEVSVDGSTVEFDEYTPYYYYTGRTDVELNTFDTLATVFFTF